MKSTFAAALFALAMPTAHALELLVPAYFYPAGNGAGYWQTLTDSAPGVGITAILNPDSGPGSELDLNYTAVVDDLQAAGGRVIGYVHTSYGTRSAATVRAEIDRYYALYGVDGIFIDEMSNDTAHLGYYLSLHDYIRGLDGDGFIVGNPGTQTTPDYLASADVLVTFESPAAEYAGYEADAWTQTQDAARFAHLVYEVPDAAAMQAVIARARAMNVGHVYVTDDDISNPWDTLPGYWSAETAAVAAVPEPSAWATLAAGLGLIGARLRRRG
ncbi:spherulation-specific family 4 protein [Methyloversatilis sp.]|uniref:spherulation-specific family 4 protein n=1 Tax=Methyloversatilis sp. TaxID=2569862 RepID=UPI0035B359CF